ncbi:MAG: hypothetical protein EA357_02510 [Micavibrio sp.]|nr:MAG: hypothetical protein EA357_02510 [Micavibrio sp.]
MGLKDWLQRQKDKVQKSADELKDPKKKQEIDIERTQQALELAQKGVAAYQNAAEKYDKAKETAAERLKGMEPLAEAIDEKTEKAVQTGKKLVGGLTNKWKQMRGGKKDQTPPAPAANDDANAPEQQPKPKGNTPGGR